MNDYERLAQECSFNGCACVDMGFESNQSAFGVVDVATGAIKAMTYSKTDADFIATAPLVIKSLHKQLESWRKFCEIEGGPVKSTFDPVTCQTLPGAEVAWIHWLRACDAYRKDGGTLKIAQIVAKGGFTYFEMDRYCPDWRQGIIKISE